MHLILASLLLSQSVGNPKVKVFDKTCSFAFVRPVILINKIDEDRNMDALESATIRLAANRVPAFIWKNKEDFDKNIQARRTILKTRITIVAPPQPEFTVGVIRVSVDEMIELPRTKNIQFVTIWESNDSFSCDSRFIDKEIESKITKQMDVLTKKYNEDVAE